MGSPKGWIRLIFAVLPQLTGTIIILFGNRKSGWALELQHMQIAAKMQTLSDARRFQLLVDAVVDYGIYMIDLHGYVLSWNAGAQRIAGYTAEEIIGQPFSRFFTPEDQARGLPEKILSETASVGRFESQGWRVRKNGTRFLASATVQPVRDEHGELIGFAKITRDVTERVAAQQALLESESRFRLLVKGVVDYAIYMLDPSGVITNWNTGAERMKGYSEEEVVGQHFSKFYPREDRLAGVPERVLSVAEREGRYEAEGWRVRKDGSRFWASVVVDVIRSPDGVLLGFAKVTRDISERRAAQDALRESERQFRLLVAAVTDYALYMLDPNGNISSWNGGAARIKGYAASEIIGQHFSRFYTEPDRAAGLPAQVLRTALAEGRFEGEGLRVRKDGSVFWANVIVDPIRDEHGTLIGYAKITRDVTERRDAQIALQAAQTQRAHAQKMDALGQLTGGVAHDFNNLLMVVSGNVHTIKKILAENKTVGEQPRIGRAAEAIELAASRGAALTRQLLSFSRRQTFNPTVFSIAERVELFRALLSTTIGAGVSIISRVGPNVWPVKVDPSELEIALVNIALNARDAMVAGGLISVTAENLTISQNEAPPDIEGEFVALRITDTGFGIAPDLLAKVFDPFFTTKPMSKGSGLGLSQVHGFAHQSGGTVTIESELGRGTTVTLYLPRAREDVRATEQGGTDELEAGSGRVLVVEDNPDVRDVTVAMLEQLGYEVTAVGDAAAALEAVEANEFDIVVSDIVMAGSMDGVALAQALRERKPELPVLLVTGYAGAAVTRPEFVVLRKPFLLADIGRAVSRMIAESRQPRGTNLVRLRDVQRTPPRPDQD